MEKNPENIFNKLKEDVADYIELKLELLKLNTYERTSHVLGVLSYGLVILFSAFFAFLFIFLALGFFLGELFHSPGLGFACVALIYILSIVIVVVNRDKISDKVKNIVIAALTASEDKNDATDDQQQATDSAGEINS